MWRTESWCKKLKSTPKQLGAVGRTKINALRREPKKVKDIIISAIETDVYVPDLCYFNEIDNLRDQKTQMQGTSTVDQSRTKSLQLVFQRFGLFKGVVAFKVSQSGSVLEISRTFIQLLV